MSRLFRILLGWVVLALFLPSAAALGTEISLPSMAAKSGGALNIPVMVDQVENLAGIKIVITYNADVLTFKGAKKTNFTDSLMHVVNDKNPGRLIIVMAGATGISGKDENLLLLTFLVKPGLKPGLVYFIDFVEAQLMTDTLKDLPVKSRKGGITISDQRSAGTGKTFA